MKKNHFIYAALALAGLLSAACTKEEPVEFGIDSGDIVIGADGGTKKVKVDVAGKWSVDVADPWILVSPASGNGSTVCDVRIDSSIQNSVREATIRFKDLEGGENRIISISQDGFPKQLTLDKTELALESYAKADERHFDIEVTSNVDFTVKIPDDAKEWIEFDEYTFELNRGARPRRSVIRFHWQGNSNEELRNAEIRFETVETGLERHDALAISQDRAPVITDDAAGDSLALVIIEDKMNVYVKWNHDEPISYWNGVTLWSPTDKECEENPDMTGRVKAVQFIQFYVDDKGAFPEEFKYLKYLQTLSLFSNGNKHLHHHTSIGGIAELENLKYLQLYSVGFTDLKREYIVPCAFAPVRPDRAHILIRAVQAVADRVHSL